MIDRAPIRTRADRCPGVLRPWPADDGLLVRLRLAGGLLPAGSLRPLLDLAAAYGDGDVHVTGRANLQVRGIARVSEEVVGAIEAAGLLPSRSHELVRNLMTSPQTGLAGGRADLRPVVAELDRQLCADPALAELPGRFLFVLDDGRGDLLGRPTDLGLVALDDAYVQLRVGPGWGPVVPLGEAPAALLELARLFLATRTTQWHVTELDRPLVPPERPRPGVPEAAEPLPYGAVPGGEHVAAPRGLLDPALADRDGDLVVTPWRGVLVPEAAR
ncbi:nitrite reductase [Nocardioides mangrovi]|uniref:Nitrite reductase n=1 Tax=Nocardioides mangrovi TaxID=2874580 RepID=A0ABS7U6B6_9ACTN|nr:nitrite reductase [Nocardioides mangrovi]MBZ5736538.1 nitrite reductase [Nocardioides mangrovi]